MTGQLIHVNGSTRNFVSGGSWWIEIWLLLVNNMIIDDTK